MASVSWTVQALDDLDAICLYIARDAPGRVVPEINQEHIREVFVHSYRIIYRVMNDAVEILTVHHGARSLGSVGS
ncbi:MAG TPA: type II toxin-antitoxin system RelE/ParE family toxin [Polyangia bacterium]|nr:type II toxin-antitoxin system RelE/ParE family toxin [Polyangia bacterium]